jgi:RNA polymerase sigma-70 factor (ECF subfamily)
MELKPFEHPAALIDFLTSKGGALDQKDRIYASLVRMAQRLEGGSELASTLLWLGLWPALDATYNRLLWKYLRDDPEALVSEIGARFTRVIHNANLSRVNRVAATLRLNVQRDILDGLKRQWADDNRSTPLPSDETEGPHASGCDLKQARARLRTRAVSELGMPPHLDVDDDIRALRAFIAKAVGDDADADLILAMAVHEGNQRDLAERVGISHEAARKRVQRALKRLRAALEKK